MATEIKVTSLGESIREGTIARWLKKDGAVVRAEEPVLELETEKATAEITSPVSGVLRIAVPEGSTVPVGSVVGHIEEVAAKPPVGGDGPRVKASGALECSRKLCATWCWKLRTSATAAFTGTPRGW